MNLDNEVLRAEEIIATLNGLMGTIGGNADEQTKLLACGKIREISQNYRLAASYYQDAIRHGKGDFEPVARLALAKMKAGAIAEGLTLARSLTSNAPKFVFKTITGKTVSSMAVLGDALRLSGEVSGAIEAYQQSVAVTDGADIYSAARAASMLLDAGDIEPATELVKTMTAREEFSELGATIALLENDINRLPAIQGVVSNSISTIAAEIAV